MRRAAAAILALIAAAGAPGPATAAQRDTPVPILLYHRVAVSSDRALSVAPELFAQQVAALDRAGHTAVTMEAVERHWATGSRLPRRPVVLSFDDGFADQYRNAARVLRAREWPGVLYLQTSRLDVAGGLTRAQVRRMLRDGWELGAHTVNHPDLTQVEPLELAAEVDGSRRALRREFPAAPVTSFAYPFGRHDAAVHKAVRAAGFTSATTTRRGPASPADVALTLDRIIVNGTFSPARLLRAVRATSGRR